ncbi:MAG: hypothetical protein S4CHLAM2_01600 [Chlamydiales bacterium]|nr:hypothetical protein [Chlamydiales bacterium]
MTLSIFLARFFGLYFVIIGFFYLLRREFIRKAARQIFDQESLVILSAVISLIIGLLIVVSHNVWEFNWRVTITIIGYLTLLKGLMRFFVPHQTDKKMLIKLLSGDNPLYLGIVCLIIGFFLTYEGFLGIS